MALRQRSRPHRGARTRSKSRLCPLPALFPTVPMKHCSLSCRLSPTVTLFIYCRTVFLLFYVRVRHPNWTPTIQKLLCPRDCLGPLVQILGAEPAPPMIFFSVGLAFTLSPVSTAEIDSDDRDALFSSVLCPEPTVTGVVANITWVEREYSRRTSFVSGTSLKRKSLG